MRSRKLVALGTLLLACGALLLAAMAPVPRKSPDFTLVEPSGKQTPLASYKGKVVVVEFMLTRCPHCWRLAQMINKLDKEMGPRGLQALGVTFDNDVNGPAVADFVGRAQVTFPVGFTTGDAVDAYLGRAAIERVQVPQIVVIDRGGTIRAQSLATGEVNLETEASLRHLLEGLLAEAAPPAG
jgi:peroxiredoxin